MYFQVFQYDIQGYLAQGCIPSHMKMPFLDMDADILALKLGTKIYRCIIAINQPLTGRKIRGIEGYGHMILESGLRQKR